MRGKFQSLALIVLILVSLVITKKAKIENSPAQPASFIEAVVLSSLSPLGQGDPAGGGEETAPPAPGPYDDLVVNIPQADLPKLSEPPALPQPAAAKATPEISREVRDMISGTKIVLVSDIDSDSDYVSYNADRRWSLASITKLMTAVLAVEDIGKDRETVPSKTALEVEGGYGRLEADRIYKVDDLLKIMLLASSNHAAFALADAYVFGQQDFVKLMNKKAGELGMNQTVFYDPAGLSPLNQSTANDIKKLMKYIINSRPEILAYSQEKNFEGIKNINIFAGRNDFLGGKTGYLDETTKQNLASLFSVGGRRILIVVLGSDGRFGQTQKLLNYLQLNGRQ